MYEEVFLMDDEVMGASEEELDEGAEPELDADDTLDTPAPVDADLDPAAEI